ncbi:hypothetical protein RY831_30935 [Noviherbaspirillum sp. CPCC 100848]|uniref:Uncharacterized protein n=1 Tax=Noviherbaspirillum album TaxID=3080276 RepID=A0ABU6JIP0_9BURK|nr:hypothetical protein [Noviherbaspirillum sp. CPCC 100848]MEC4723557.1 hypothetical protein [Noviherbaspirillum sp. CPCC 100848]
MANLGPAAKAVEQELMHARQGMEYYAKLVENLEGVLETLTTIDTPATGARTKARTASTSKAKGKTANQSKTAASKGGKRSKLPPTGKDFWPTLLTDTPQPASEVFKAAINALGIKLDADDRKKLTQRMSNALSVMAKNGEIKAEGSARARLYSKKTVIH